MKFVTNSLLVVGITLTVFCVTLADTAGGAGGSYHNSPSHDHLRVPHVSAAELDISAMVAKLSHRIDALELKTTEQDEIIARQSSLIETLQSDLNRLEQNQASHRRRLEEVEFASDECTPALRTEFLKNETTGAFILDEFGDKIVERRACVFPPVGRYEFIDNFVRFDGPVEFNDDVEFVDNVRMIDIVDTFCAAACSKSEFCSSLTTSAVFFLFFFSRPSIHSIYRSHSLISFTLTTRMVSISMMIIRYLAM
jgi:uncharacterized coiled-coil protein SlyX